MARSKSNRRKSSKAYEVQSLPDPPGQKPSPNALPSLEGKSPAHDTDESSQQPTSTTTAPILKLPTEILHGVLSYLFPTLPNGRPAQLLELAKPHTSYICPPKALALLLTCREIYQKSHARIYENIDWQLPDLGFKQSRSIGVRNHYQSRLSTMNPSALASLRFVRGTSSALDVFLDACESLGTVELSHLHVASMHRPFEYEKCIIAGQGVIYYRPGCEMRGCNRLLYRNQTISKVDLLLLQPEHSLPKDAQMYDRVSRTVRVFDRERQKKRLEDDIMSQFEIDAEEMKKYPLIGPVPVTYRWYSHEQPEMRLTMFRATKGSTRKP